jgi:DNA-binding NtrC family response regulator
MKANLRLLLVDRDRSSLSIMHEITRHWDFKVSTARSAIDAIERIDARDVDIVVTDLDLPDGSGLDIVRHAADAPVPVGSIVISANGTIAKAVEAIHVGAYDFLTKPVDLAKLNAILPSAFEKERLRLENTRLRSRIGMDERPDGIIGNSPAIRRVVDRIRLAASARSTVLITGESGTGKELIASAIHKLSPRADETLVKVACGALSPQLLESELFGHERGAFTGAFQQRRGRFELAEGGTLFLDEIDDLDVSLQGKLLRVLQEREFERVGGEETITVDVRLIAATNSNLENLVAGEGFRQDLFYRLNVVRIEAPSLRERRDDIPLLVDNFVKKYARENGKEIRGIDAGAMSVLQGHEWPGNVRELENAIESAVVMCTGDIIQSTHLPEHIQPGTSEKIAFHVGAALADIERQAIEATLRSTSDNKTLAAKMLGIGVRTIHDKLKKYREQEEATAE